MNDTEVDNSAVAQKQERRKENRKHISLALRIQEITARYETHKSGRRRE
jgi:hypothetical protein